MLPQHVIDAIKHRFNKEELNTISSNWVLHSTMDVNRATITELSNEAKLVLIHSQTPGTLSLA